MTGNKPIIIAFISSTLMEVGNFIVVFDKEITTAIQIAIGIASLAYILLKIHKLSKQK